MNNLRIKRLLDIVILTKNFQYCLTYEIDWKV